jgi:lactate 2-monooxygenase
MRPLEPTGSIRIGSPGRIEAQPDPSTEGPGPEVQSQIFSQGFGGKRPKLAMHPDALEQQAAACMDKRAFDYIAGAAGIESTKASNREAFNRVQIRRHVLRDVSKPDMRTELFSMKMDAPILIAPMGAMALAHKDADLGIAKGARANGIPMVISSQGCKAMEETGKTLAGSPCWFQLYWGKSDEVMRSFVARAKSMGAKAIVVTVDNELFGWRARDLENGFSPFLLGLGVQQYASDPAFQKLMKAAKQEGSSDVPKNLHTLFSYWKLLQNYPGGLVHNLVTGDAKKGVETFVENFSRPSLSWEDLPTLRAATDLPIIIKGIMTPEDAQKAIACGAQGIIVSNHGGRQIDGEMATLDALPAIVDAVGGKVPVLLDSGVRTGADVFKALALGAKAVLVGRPCAYGLAVNGGDGVSEVLRNLKGDFDVTMREAGCAKLSEIDRSCVTA